MASEAIKIYVYIYIYIYTYTYIYGEMVTGIVTRMLTSGQTGEGSSCFIMTEMKYKSKWNIELERYLGVRDLGFGLRVFRVQGLAFKQGCRSRGRGGIDV